MRDGSSLSKRAIRLRAPGMNAALPGVDPDQLGAQQILLVGCGSLGGEIALGLVRTGIGHLVCCDPGLVTLANMYRYPFYAEDVEEKKALRLAHRLTREAPRPMAITGLAMSFREAYGMQARQGMTLALCAVNNDAVRIEVARWALEQHLPVIFAAINHAANSGYAFAQTSRHGEPCFGCLAPDAVRAPVATSSPAGATVEIFKAVAGLALYPALALVMPARPWQWRFKEMSPAGIDADGARTVVRRNDCPLCTHMPDEVIIID